ncbi:MAG TPA: hypothetical protein VL172_17400 [Kofleriaceae bacterium]|nr:hypothetical protein [Kofleriaceae bacterium]
MNRSIALSCWFLLLGARAASAGWTHEVSFSRSEATSIKVVEPDGFKVSIVIGGEVKSDSVPAVFTLPDQDGYYEVAVTAPDGATWSRKIEVRVRQQTSLAVRYVADAATPAPPAGHNYIGRLRNTTHRCQAPVEVRWDFLLDGKPVVSRVVPPGKQANNVEVVAGSYDVRVFGRGAADQPFKYLQTDRVEVKADGWQVEFGCAE